MKNSFVHLFRQIALAFVFMFLLCNNSFAGEYCVYVDISSHFYKYLTGSDTSGRNSCYSFYNLKNYLPYFMKDGTTLTMRFQSTYFDHQGLVTHVRSNIDVDRMWDLASKMTYNGTTITDYEDSGLKPYTTKNLSDMPFYNGKSPVVYGFFKDVVCYKEIDYFRNDYRAEDRKFTPSKDTKRYACGSQKSIQQVIDKKIECYIIKHYWYLYLKYTIGENNFGTLTDGEFKNGFVQTAKKNGINIYECDGDIAVSAGSTPNLSTGSTLHVYFYVRPFSDYVSSVGLGTDGFNSIGTFYGIDAQAPEHDQYCANFDAYAPVELPSKYKNQGYKGYYSKRYISNVPFGEGGCNINWNSSNCSSKFHTKTVILTKDDVKDLDTGVTPTYNINVVIPGIFPNIEHNSAWMTINNSDFYSYKINNVKFLTINNEGAVAPTSTNSINPYNASGDKVIAKINNLGDPITGNWKFNWEITNYSGYTTTKNTGSTAQCEIDASNNKSVVCTAENGCGNTFTVNFNNKSPLIILRRPDATVRVTTSRSGADFNKLNYDDEVTFEITGIKGGYSSELSNFNVSWYYNNDFSNSSAAGFSKNSSNTYSITTNNQYKCTINGSVGNCHIGAFIADNSGIFSGYLASSMWHATSCNSNVFKFGSEVKVLVSCDKAGCKVLKGTEVEIKCSEVSGGWVEEGYKYQWYESTDNKEWNLLKDSTKSSIKIKKSSSVSNKYWYKCKVENNGSYFDSDVIDVSWSGDASFSISGKTNAASGETVTFECNAPEESTYQWYLDGQDDKHKINNATSSKYTVDGSNYSGTKHTVYCKVNYLNVDKFVSHDCSWNYPAVSVTISKQTGTAVQPTNGYSVDTKITLTSSVAGGKLSSHFFQWQKSSDNITFSDIKGATNLSYTASSPNSDSGGKTYYRVLVTSYNFKDGAETKDNSKYSAIIDISWRAKKLSVVLDGEDKTLPYPEQSKNGNSGKIVASPKNGGGEVKSSSWSYSQTYSPNQNAYIDFISINDDNKPNWVDDLGNLTLSFKDLNKSTAFKCTCSTDLDNNISSNVRVFTVVNELVPGKNNDPIGPDYTLGSNSINTNCSEASGGDSKYEYNWVLRSYSETKAEYSTSQNLTNLAPSNNTIYQRTDYCFDGKMSATGPTITIKVPINAGKPKNETEETICYGSTFTSIEMTDAKGGNGDYDYIWYYYTGDVKSGKSNASQVTGSVSNKSYLPGYKLTETTHFYRIVKDKWKQDFILTSDDAESETFTVNVLSEFKVEKSNDTVVCYNSNVDELHVHPVGGSSDYKYSWSYNKNSNQSVLSQSSTLNNPDLISSSSSNEQNTIFRCIVSNQCASRGTGYDTSFITVKMLKSVSIGSSYFDGTSKTSDLTVNYGNINNIKLYCTEVNGGSGNFDIHWTYLTSGTTQWQEFSSSEDKRSYEVDCSSLTKNTKFRIKVHDKVCNSDSYGDNLNLTVVAFKTPVINSGLGQTICYNTVPSALRLTTKPGTGTYTYRWYKKSASVGSDGDYELIEGAVKDNLTFTNTSNNKLTESTYFKVVAQVSADQIKESAPILVTVLDEFKGGQISLLSNEVCSESTIEHGKTAPTIVSFEDMSGGDESKNKYQWYKKGANETSFAAITGANNSSYEPGIVKSTCSYYRSAIGTCGTFNSNTVTIICDDINYFGGDDDDPNNGGTDSEQGQQSGKPYLSQAQYICYNTVPANLSIMNLGGKNYISYSWFKKSINDTDYSLIEGQVSSVLTFAKNTKNKHSVSTYYKAKLNLADGRFIETDPILITVLDEVLPGSIGIGLNYSESDTIYFGTVPTKILCKEDAEGGSIGEDIVYQWYKKEEGETNYSAIEGAVDSDYQPGKLTLTTQFYRAVVDDCSESYSNVVKFVVKQLDFNLDGYKERYCYGDKVTVTVTGLSGMSFKWKSQSGQLLETGNKFSISKLVSDTTILLYAYDDDLNQLAEKAVKFNLVSMKPSFTSSKTLLEAGEAIHFVNESKDFNSCLWDFGDGQDKSTDVNPWHYFNVQGTFNVKLKLISEEGCESELEKKNMITVSGEYNGLIGSDIEYCSFDDLRIYPNPTSDIINVEKAGNFKVVLFDYLRRTLLAQEGFDKVQFDLSDYSNGIYYLSVDDGENNKVVKIVKY